VQSRQDIDLYFEKVWQNSHAGELYLNSTENLEQFTDSLVGVVA